MNINNKNLKIHQRGFTLVELMVSLSIFIIVVLAAVGSLYTVNNASRKVQAMRSVLDNLNFAVESLSRSVRTSNSVVCGGSLNVSGDPNCSFSSQSQSSMLLVDSTIGVNTLVEYRLGFYPNGNGTIQKRNQESGIWTNWISLTSSEIDIEQLIFYVEGASPSDGAQTSVSVFIKGSATTGDSIAPFSIQTYLSQRTTE